ncbi:hypothetical protein QO004_001015 [Rhizobium mesoamericanum]|uniref:hypothetical protein n=1 Tax=Rhizobium mesoamericanum TaxID=1079800 RepID=UPI00278A3B22|nr:hypothetical protein [Rhizobium mesoamericanum]MDQ0559237.1 hypothetical protein [Rhizobium mesoamericanum]
MIEADRPPASIEMHVGETRRRPLVYARLSRWTAGSAPSCGRKSNINRSKTHICSRQNTGEFDAEIVLSSAFWWASQAQKQAKILVW